MKIETVNQIEIDSEDFEYLLENIDELDDFLFTDITANEVIDIESRLLGDF